MKNNSRRVILEKKGETIRREKTINFLLKKKKEDE